ncbi:MAG: UbiA family prenyltransferase [Ignavibacteria bacterium]|nr:UbiA family prenyltransferase [Ignavibacteria bacterium]
MSASVLSLRFAKGYWITMRPYLLFVSGITGIAGLSFAPQLSLPETAILFLVFFFSYGFGQALTDCFQTDTDAISSPYRPIVRGEINKNHVLFVSFIFLSTCGIILALFSTSSFLLALLCVFGLSTYTFFKRRWWGGPFYNGWIVAVLFLIGYYSGLKNSSAFLTPQILAALVSVLFGYANFVLVGYYKDVTADSKTGYNTFVVVFGRKAAAIVSDVFALVFVVCGISAFALSNNVNSTMLLLLSVSFLLTSVIASVYTQVQLHKVTNDTDAHRAVSPSVHTYILMFCAIASINKPEWMLVLILFYLGFVITLNVRPEKSQI